MLGSTEIVAFVPTTDSQKARFFKGILGLRFVKDDGFAPSEKRRKTSRLI